MILQGSTKLTKWRSFEPSAGTHRDSSPATGTRPERGFRGKNGGVAKQQSKISTDVELFFLGDSHGFDLILRDFTGKVGLCRMNIEDLNHEAQTNEFCQTHGGLKGGRTFGR